MEGLVGALENRLSVFSYQSPMPAGAGTPSMKMRPGRWKCLGVVGATLPLWIPAPYRGTGHAFDRRNDELGAGVTRQAGLTGAPIFVPIADPGCCRHTKV